MAYSRVALLVVIAIAAVPSVTLQHQASMLRANKDGSNGGGKTWRGRRGRLEAGGAAMRAASRSLLRVLRAVPRVAHRRMLPCAATARTAA